MPCVATPGVALAGLVRRPNWPGSKRSMLAINPVNASKRLEMKANTVSSPSLLPSTQCCKRVGTLCPSSSRRPRPSQRTTSPKSRWPCCSPYPALPSSTSPPSFKISSATAEFRLQWSCAHEQPLRLRLLNSFDLSAASMRNRVEETSPTFFQLVAGLTIGYLAGRVSKEQLYLVATISKRKIQSRHGLFLELQ